ncbi:hypothetical protein STEG23_005921 [Scotinomys teguina]
MKRAYPGHERDSKSENNVQEYLMELKTSSVGNDSHSNTEPEEAVRRKLLVPANEIDPIDALKQIFSYCQSVVPYNSWNSFMRKMGLTDNEIQVAKAETQTPREAYQIVPNVAERNRRSAGEIDSCSRSECQAGEIDSCSRSECQAGEIDSCSRSECQAGEIDSCSRSECQAGEIDSCSRSECQAGEIDSCSRSECQAGEIDSCSRSECRMQARPLKM